jgi:hypothetical protein
LTKFAPERRNTRLFSLFFSRKPVIQSSSGPDRCTRIFRAAKPDRRPVRPAGYPAHPNPTPDSQKSALAFWRQCDKSAIEDQFIKPGIGV